jgi:uncharacterized protein with von Willebrand factor type A (vWA) domain
MTDTITRHICEMIAFFRDEFKALPFDFHSCFYFNEEYMKNEEGEELNCSKFSLHRKY